MNSVEFNIKTSEEGVKTEFFNDIVLLTERLDFLDIQLLRKFYIVDREPPFDTQPYCFPVLYHEMKVANQIKIGMEALRKRLNNLVKLGLLEKIKHSNPVCYVPVNGRGEFVKMIIKRFLFINGLINFL
jgi:hypothetical protein